MRLLDNRFLKKPTTENKVIILYPEAEYQKSPGFEETKIYANDLIGILLPHGHRNNLESFGR